MTDDNPTRRAATWGALSMAATPFAAAAQAPQGVKLRRIKTNGITLRIAEMGHGPLVILVHGWPESWYSWRRQMPALAAAGFHVVAPDMRGYGASDKPSAVEDYDMRHTTGDLAGLVTALGETSAILVGHDWGAIMSWQAMLLHPEKFSALAALSVPYGGRPPASPIDSMRARFKDNFYYILYFQQPGLAEAEFDADPRAILSRLYTSPDTPTAPPRVTDPKMAAGGWIDRLGAPKALPPWLSQSDLDYYVGEFRRAGFRGGINYYRNFDRNWRTTPELAGVKIKQPVIFLAGEKDIVIGGATADALTASMRRVCEDFRGVVLFPGAGHWVQQERAAEVNRTLLDFLTSVSPRQA
ncbi:MAG: alpha/beta fold hydrolase [Phenylobacterium sp.]